MARGLQKIQSQKKNLEKQQQSKKASSGGKNSAEVKLTYLCQICKAQMPDPKTYKSHFESKHPKAELPAELREI
nr:zinc finger protein 706 gene 2 [Hymenolepis microstoma]